MVAEPLVLMETELRMPLATMLGSNNEPAVLLISLSENLQSVVPGRRYAFRVFSFYAVIFVELCGKTIFSLANFRCGYSKV